MIEQFFTTPLDPGKRLQQQIQERLIEAILAGALPLHEPLPATRVMARRIGVARNTVTLVYERLAEDGFLKPVNRRGYFINERTLREQLNIRVESKARRADEFDATERLNSRFADQVSIVKATNWRDYEFPFVYGQLIPDKVSVSRWRDAIRLAGTAQHTPSWIFDQVDGDDPMLVEHIIRRILPQRGFRATPEEILVTVGAQNALFTTAMALCGPGKRVDVEDPGYVDAHNIFRGFGAEIRPHPIDGNGLKVSPALAGADLVYVTPGHQCPTNVTMGMERRLSLLSAAEVHDFLILEDDYEHELNFVGAQKPALKALDERGRVIHVSSLTKPLFPGLRLGFIAASPPIIRHLRALRRLICRHPSALDQRALAIFLAEGHYDAHIRRHRAELSAKWRLILSEIHRQMPECSVTMTTGGSGLWLRLPEDLRATTVQAEAARRGILVEAGDVHYLKDDAPTNRLRLGFAAIPKDRIAAGISRLASTISALRGLE
ncbi:PLP-dependent aminotransferase family protein [Martelella alba]|uniref:PLP-dependent aminotransferase family protein n=1 Tax=Martelella alba TaxID=2590451 RepID=A0A506U9I9_9HYPH|nr:PLP-dependent aminotransferase family protein [Martelella alba]TPW29249.1 PLP-dependent aminotransferase family protein [Martelella alba]